MYLIMKEYNMQFDYQEFTSGFNAVAKACFINFIEQEEKAKKFAENRPEAASIYEKLSDAALCKYIFFSQFNRQDIESKAEMLNYLEYLAMQTLELKPPSAFNVEFVQKQWIELVKEYIAEVEKMDG